MPAYPEEYSRILDELVLLRAQTMYLAETSVGSARAAYVQAAAHLESAVTLLAALLGVQPPPAAPAYVRSPPRS